ncbi:uncharacterized protein PRCAT00001020001 [Priceomyces carsonii]|uniref:uncharacterized protein n=1 Tax=Priceomyces carsonii TaxID=28549 RepID=UPI002ED91D1D|nr:unnamed protein product [Priceomyces carsonii]
MDRRTLLFLIIMFLFLSLPSGNDQPHSEKDKETLTQFQKELKRSTGELKKSAYSTGYGNITGFELSYNDNVKNKKVKDWPIHKYNPKHPWKEDQEFSILPNVVSDRIKLFWGTDKVDSDDDKAYLLNISGRAYGEFAKWELKEPLKEYELKLPTYLSDYYNQYNKERYDDPEEGYKLDGKTTEQKEVTDAPKVGNITNKEGKISLKIKGSDYNYKLSKYRDLKDYKNLKIDDAILVSLDINIHDYDEIEDTEIDSIGIYFQKIGAIVATTNSAKFLGDYGLPHLGFNEENFNISKILIGQQLESHNIGQDITIDSMNSYLSRSEQCEFLSFFQFEKTDFNKETLIEIDDELMHPCGRPIPKHLPNLEIKDYVLYSPDCGLILTTKAESKLEGLKVEVLNKKLKGALSGLLMLVCLQLILFLRQIKKTRTPGQLSAISSKTLFFIGFQDSLIVLFFLLMSTIFGDLYLLLTCIGVIAFIMCGIFEVRFMISVLTSQANERDTTWWEILRGGSSLASDTESPAAAQTETPQQPFTGNDETRFSNSIFASGFPLTVIATFIIFNSLTWRVKYRRIFEYVGLIITNTYWIPQFLRNTLKNRRRSLSWEFIVGTSVLRFIPVFYLSIFLDNPLRHHKDHFLPLVLFSWLLVQIFLLFLQSILGPRFWVNEKWLPDAYDYQPVLSVHDLENGFASDILSNIRTDQELSKVVDCKVDCAICMNEINLPVVTDDDSKKKITKKTYMITPCRHIFHEECLQDWMKYKLQCPVCRNSLPPI